MGKITISQLGALMVGIGLFGSGLSDLLLIHHLAVALDLGLIGAGATALGVHVSLGNGGNAAP